MKPLKRNNEQHMEHWTGRDTNSLPKNTDSLYIWYLCIFPITRGTRPICYSPFWWILVPSVLATFNKYDFVLCCLHMGLRGAGWGASPHAQVRLPLRSIDHMVCMHSACSPRIDFIQSFLAEALARVWFNFAIALILFILAVLHWLVSIQDGRYFVSCATLA